MELELKNDKLVIGFRFEMQNVKYKRFSSSVSKSE